MNHMTVVVTPMLLINICTYLLRMGAAAVGDASPRFEILWGRHPEITIFEKRNLITHKCLRFSIVLK